MRLGNTLTRRGINEAKLKKQSTSFKPNNFKRLRNNKLFKKLFYMNVLKIVTKQLRPFFCRTKPQKWTKDADKLK